MFNTMSIETKKLRELNETEKDELYSSIVNVRIDNIKNQIKGVNIDFIYRGFTHLLLSVHNLNIVDLLIDNKADVNKTDEMGYSPLMRSVSCNCDKSVESLL